MKVNDGTHASQSWSTCLRNLEQPTSHGVSPADLPCELSLERVQCGHNSRPGKYNDVLT